MAFSAPGQPVAVAWTCGSGDLEPGEPGGAAGGLELAIWCDLRIAASDATFGVFCRRWEVPLTDGGTVRLPRLIGESRAMGIFLTGRAVDVAEALDSGLANRVVEPGTALEAAGSLDRDLTAFPQACMRNDHRSAMAQSGRAEDDAMDYEIRVGLESLATDATGGAARFSDGEGRHGSFS